MEEINNKFFYAGNAGYSNKGCEAIIRGTNNLLSEVFGEIQVFSAYFHGNEPNDTKNEQDKRIYHLPINPIKRFQGNWFKFRFLKLINSSEVSYVAYKYLIPYLSQSKIVLMLGGDNYSLDYGYPDKFFALNRFVIENEKPFVIWGASIGKFTKDPVYEKKAANELKKANRIYVRETKTLKYLQSIGVEENIQLSADPSFWLQSTPPNLEDQLIKILNSGCVGLNLSPLLFKKVTPDFNVAINRSVEIVKQLIRSIEYPILLIPHVISHIYNIYADDHAFMKIVFDKIDNKKDKLFLLGRNYSASETKWIINKLIAFAGARTHSTFASISSGVPTISIGYSIKAEGINQDLFNSDEWLISIENLTPKLLLNKFNQIINNREDIQNYLFTKIPIFRKRALAAAIDLKSIVDLS